MALSPTVQAKLRAIDNLPTLPTIATQLLELLGRMEVSMHEISRLMELDPAITAQILKVANSAYYGLRISVDTVQRALVVLGVNEITNIILSLSLFKSFPSSTAAEFDQSVFWAHSGVVGFLCRTLANEFSIPAHGEEFTAGLMHDIGKIVIEQHFNRELQEIAVEMSASGDAGWLVEKRILQMDHADIGAYLGTRWEIPSNIREAILYHHEPAQATEDQRLTALVHLADMFAVGAGYQQKYDGWTPDVKTSPAWSLLGVDPADIDWPHLEAAVREQIERASAFLSVALP